MLRSAACGPRPCPRACARRTCRQRHPWRRKRCNIIISIVDPVCNRDEKSMFLPSGNVGVGVLGDLLVGFLGSAAGCLLNSLRNVVGTLLERIHCDCSVVGLDEVVLKYLVK